jgi:hypothetical protein
MLKASVEMCAWCSAARVVGAYPQAELKGQRVVFSPKAGARRLSRKRATCTNVTAIQRLRDAGSQRP